jgi:hypothetical protein
MNDNVVVPAASFEKFGAVTEDFSSKIFIMKGHWLRRLKLCDLNLMIYVDKNREAVAYPLKGQRTKNGMVPMVCARTSISTRIGGKQVFYSNANDSRRADVLFTSCVDAVMGTIRSMSLSHKNEALVFLERRVRESTAFIVSQMETVNILTGDVCFWKTGTYTINTPCGKRDERRLKMEGLNGVKAESIDRNTLFKAAGEMFEDQCQLGTITQSVCMAKANKCNSKYIKSIW